MTSVRSTKNNTGQPKQQQYQPHCIFCDNSYPLERLHLGYAVCLPCGDEIAKERKFTVAPMHKSNYMLITNHDDLKGLNNKGGLIK